MNPNPPPNIYIVGAQCTGKTTLVNNLRAHFHRPHNNNDNDNDNDNNDNDNDNNNITNTNTNPPPSPPPPAIITEVARTVLATHHFTAQDVRIPARSLALQQLILEAQAAAEERALLETTAGAGTEAVGGAGGADGTEGGGGGGDSGSGSGPGWFISDRSGADPIAYALRYAGGEEARRALAGTVAWAGLRARMRRSLVVVCEAGAATAAAGWLRDDGVRLMPQDVDEWAGFHRAFCRLLEAEAVPYVVLGVGVGGREERVRFVLEKWRERAAQV